MVAEEARRHQAEMGGGLPPGAAAVPMGFDCSKAYAAARDGLGMARHGWVLEGVEKRLLGERYPSTRSATEAFLSMDGGGVKKPGAGAGADGLRKRK